MYALWLGFLGLLLVGLPFAISKETSSGNGCPESQPWPCKTAGHCLSFDFICDGDRDCSDGYDEDKSLCTAKSRPAYTILKGFVEKYYKWLVPKYLGEGSVSAITTQLIESMNLDDYSKKMKLTDDQYSNLMNLLEAVGEGRQIELIMDGMPPKAWNELSLLFGRIVSSGFI